MDKIDYYINKLNSECLHKYDMNVQTWRRCDISNIDSMCDYCIKIDLGDNVERFLCEMCKNIRDISLLK